jgi:HAD superfamily hydrolase (TIGR01509 family)
VRFAAVIFDFDGVVADSELHANKSLAEYLTAAGMPTSFEDCLRDYYGHNWRETQNRIEARFGRTIPAGFLESHREHARVSLEQSLAPVAGVAEFLERLGAMPRAVASSSSADYINWALQRFGLAYHFEGHVYSADGWERGKPHPDIYLAAARGLGADPARCLAIEDSPTGARSALSAGMTVIGFCGASHIIDRAAHGQVLKGIGVQRLSFVYDDIWALV